MRAYYNDNEAFCCQWLGSLMKERHITQGFIDRRDIKDVSATDVMGYERVHFFAGIAGWEYALDLAGWGTRPIWTASCPCQPFSNAGQRRGVQDERHLWPTLYALISECCPATIFGEQVSSRLGRTWLAGVFADLENLGYAVAGADLCAAGVGAPHLRHRLFWVAVSGQPGLEERTKPSAWQECSPFERGRHACGLGDAISDREIWAGRTECQSNATREAVGVFHPDSASQDQRSSGRQQPLRDQHCQGGFWDSYAVITDIYGKTRRIVAAPQLLAHGFSSDMGVLSPGGTFKNRMNLLRGFGNAIVPQIAAVFIRACMESFDAIQRR
jgi:DNA (cytosine-5)-methyltransferase 1